MGFIRKSAPTGIDPIEAQYVPAETSAAPVVEADQVLKDTISDLKSYRVPGGLYPDSHTAADKVQVMNAVITSPLIANLALTVPEDKRGELIEKYYDLALRLIRK